MGPGPVPSDSTSLRRCGSPSAARSAPAQKLPPAPVSTATLTLSSSSNSWKAARSASAVGRSTALRLSGRLMVIVRTGPSVSVMIGKRSRRSPSLRHPALLFVMDPQYHLYRAFRVRQGGDYPGVVPPPRLQRFQDRGHAWPPPMHWVARAYFTFSRCSSAAAAGDARAGGAQRVADGHATAVQVDGGRVQIQVADAGQRLRRMPR